MAWETGEQVVHAAFLNSRRQPSKPVQDSSSRDLCSTSATIPATRLSYQPLPPGQPARERRPWATSWCSDTDPLQLPKRWCPAPQPLRRNTPRVWTGLTGHCVVRQGKSLLQRRLEDQQHRPSSNGTASTCGAQLNNCCLSGRFSF